jgi:hypothetical protein
MRGKKIPKMCKIEKYGGEKALEKKSHFINYIVGNN